MGKPPLLRVRREEEPSRGGSYAESPAAQRPDSSCAGFKLDRELHPAGGHHSHQSCPSQSSELLCHSYRVLAEASSSGAHVNIHIGSPKCRHTDVAKQADMLLYI